MNKWAVAWVLVSSLVVWTMVSDMNKQNNKTELSGVLSWEKIGQWDNISFSEILIWVLVQDAMAGEKEYALTYEFFNISGEKISKEKINEVNRVLWEIESEFGEDGMKVTKWLINSKELDYEMLTKYLYRFYGKIQDIRLEILSLLIEGTKNWKYSIKKNNRYRKRTISRINSYINNEKGR